MTAEWMVYCALLVAPRSPRAAWLIECVLRRGRAPLRAIWVAALALSIVGPVDRLLPAAAERDRAGDDREGVASPVTVVMTRASDPTRVGVAGRAARPRTRSPADGSSCRPRCFCMWWAG